LVRTFAIHVSYTLGVDRVYPAEADGLARDVGFPLVAAGRGWHG